MISQMIGVEGGSTEGFLAGFSLESLVAPEDLDIFVDSHWDRAPLAVKRGFADFYDGLTSLAEIDAAIAASAFRTSCVDARDGKGRTWIPDPEDSTRPAMNALLARMNKGATLILDDADRVLPGLGRISRLLMAETGHVWHCNLYATPPGGQGFDAHVDDAGVFILQIAGKKRWTYGREQVRRPISGEGGSAASEDWETDAEQFTLAPGDLLYLPRGVPHAAEAPSDSGSLHVTLTVAETSWAECAGLDAPLSDSDRDLLPIGFQLDADALQAALAQRHPDIAKGRIDAFLSAQARRFRPDLSGRFTRAMHPPDLTPDTRTRKRKDLFWHITGAEAQRALICGPIRLSFPMRAEAFVRRLLTRAGVAQDTDSDLSPDEQAAIAGMLLQHGLIRLG